MKKLFTYFLCLSFLFIYFPTNFAHAAAPSPTPSVLCDNSGTKISTALGCIPVNGNEAIATLISWALGIATGISVIMLGYSGFLITTAAGDSKRVQAGRELLVAVLSGMFLIACSVVILNFIGVKVLNLGNLGFNV